MIRKSGYRFSERIMRKQKDKSGMTFRRSVVTLWGARLQRWFDVSPNVPLGQSRISGPDELTRHLRGLARKRLTAGDNRTDPHRRHRLLPFSRGRSHPILRPWR